MIHVMDQHEARFLIRSSVYQKALKDISNLMNEEMEPLDWLNAEEDYDFMFSVLSQLTDPVVLRSQNESFLEMLNVMQENIQGQSFSVDIVSLFSFEILLDHSHLFTVQEQQEWKERMDDLFTGETSSLFLNYYDFYKLYFKPNFFEGSSDYFSKHTLYMKYAYLLIIDGDTMGFHTFGPKEIRQVRDFVFECNDFLEAFTKEIKKRRGGVKSA